MDVYEYAMPVTDEGASSSWTRRLRPGSATGQVAGGANMICFTTGRGSVYGCKPSPSLKLATNTTMYERMEDDMDINCGQILDGSLGVQEAGEKIFRLILATASGEPSKSESMGSGRTSSSLGT
jgi:altronate hydrolase